MAILDGDIQLLQSVVLDDVPEGGGMATGQEVVDGVSNNLFPDISQLDRTYGRISLRKVFPAVLTDTVDGYYGSHVIIAKAPEDPRVSATLFTNSSWTDQLTDARNKLESYTAMGYDSRYSLYGNHLAGQRSVRLHCAKSTPNPGIGDVYCLVKKVGGDYQYVRIIRIIDRLVDQVFTDSSGDYLRDVLYLEIPDPLRMDFEGRPVTRYTNDWYDPPTRFNTTFPVDATSYCGVVGLAQAADVGDLTIKATSVYTQLLPSALSEVPIIDARCAGDRDLILPIVGATAMAFSSTVVTTPGEVATRYFGTSVARGSVQVTVAGVTLSDDSAGNLIPTAGFSGSVNYETGAVSIARSTGINGQVSGTAAHAVALSLAAHTATTPITIGNRGYTYVKNLSPVPSPGSVSIDYMALGKWYRLVDNGAGGISGDDGVGSGTVDYATGSISVTLGALPDVNTSVFFAWGTPTHHRSYVGGAVFQPPAIKITIPGGALEPGQVTVTYTAGGDPWSGTDDGAGAFTTNVGVGWVDYANGVIVLRPFFLPDPGSDVVTQYKQGGVVNEVHVATGGSTNFSLGNAVKPKSLTLTFVDSAGGRHRVGDDGAGALVVIEALAPAVINGSYNLAAWQESMSSMHITSTAGVGGSINYVTGAVALGAQIEIEVSAFAEDALNRTKNWSYQPFTANAVGNIMAKYRIAGNLAGVIQTFSQPVDALQMDLLPSVSNTLVPGSLRFVMAGSVFVDRGGAIIRDPSPVTNSGVVAGTVNYADGIVTLTDYPGGGSPAATVACLVRRGVWADYEFFFRVLGAPIQPASFALRANIAIDSSQITASSDLAGAITGAKAEGEIDAQFGLVSVRFGEWVDDASLTPQEKAEWWYVPANVVAGQIFRPSRVLTDTALYNAVAVSNLPLSAAVLGLDPTRLPVDGRVPVVRKGDVLVVHHAATTAPAGVANGQTINLGRVRLARVRVIGANDATITTGYTQDLDAGTVTFTDVTGYSQPVRIEHRIEDMALCSDAQINGDLMLTTPLTHDFPLGSLVSSALIMGDLKARVSHWFDQQTWTGVWSDTLIGTDASSSYNTVQHPIVVTNRGAIQERWRLVFTNTTTVNVIGETVGQIVTGHAIANLLAPINPATGVPYFSIEPAGWGGGWSAGNVVRLNTVAANYPVWVARTVLQGPASQANDSFTIGVRGDVDTP